MYDQDYQLMYQMTTLDNIYGFVAKVRNLEGKDIHKLTSQERKLARYLRELGLL